MSSKYLKICIAVFLCLVLTSSNVLVTLAENKTQSVQGLIKNIGDNVGDVVSENAQKAGEALSDTAQKTEEAAKNVGESAKDTAQQAGDIIGKGAEDVGKTAGKLANAAGKSIVSTFEKIDPKIFNNGWDFMAKIGGSTMAASMGQSYVNSVQKAIDNTRDAVVKTAQTNQTLEVKSGYLAEQWIAETLNVDATVKGTGESAKAVNTKGAGTKASTDIETSWGESASSKYYKTAEASATEQAKTWITEYNKYCNKQRKAGKECLSEEEYLNQYNKDLSDLYKSIYDGQTRLIPSDQLRGAADFLNKKAVSKSFNEREAQRLVGEANKETMLKLKDRLESPKGASSKPLTRDEAKMIAELCENGEFKPEDFGLKVSDLITTKYILKQSIGAGVTSASIRAACTVGPQIYSIVSKAIETGEIDPEDVKKMGIDGALAGSRGFLEGSISCAILTACKAGKFGPGLVSASPDVVGALTVLAIDSLIYGYQLSQGKITTAEYADILASEIFVSIVTIGTVALLVHFLPAIPIIYLAGSLAGGMLGSAGYSIGKELVLEVVGEGGFETIVPVACSNTVDIGKKIISKMNLNEKLTDYENLEIFSTSDGKLKVKPIKYR